MPPRNTSNPERTTLPEQALMAELQACLAPLTEGASLPVDAEWFGRDLADALAPVLDGQPVDEGSVPAPLAALERSGRGIVLTDATGAIVWANPAFIAATGYSLEESRGRSPGSLVFSGEQDAAFYDDLWRTIQTGDVWRGVVRNRRRGGEFYAEEMIVAPIRSRGDAITHFVAVKAELPDGV